jgi:hypothetical protein
MGDKPTNLSLINRYFWGVLITIGLIGIGGRLAFSADQSIAQIGLFIFLFSILGFQLCMIKYCTTAYCTDKLKPVLKTFIHIGELGALIIFSLGIILTLYFQFPVRVPAILIISFIITLFAFRLMKKYLITNF